MATLSQLVKGFRANVRVGIQTGLYFDGKTINLYCPNQEPKGYIGLTTRPSIARTPKCYRVWFANGSAILVDAVSPQQARIYARAKSELPDLITRVEKLG